MQFNNKDDFFLINPKSKERNIVPKEAIIAYFQSNIESYTYYKKALEYNNEVKHYLNLVGGIVSGIGAIPLLIGTIGEISTPIGGAFPVVPLIFTSGLGYLSFHLLHSNSKNKKLYLKNINNAVESYNNKVKNKYTPTGFFRPEFNINMGINNVAFTMNF